MGGYGVGQVGGWWSAGFVANPFRALSPGEWEQIAHLPDAVRALLNRIDAPHLQVIGDAGRGKSSLLRATIRYAKRRGVAVCHEYLPVGTEAFTLDLPRNGWFCLDEAQRLRSGERARLLTKAKERNTRLFVATHEDLAPLFSRFAAPLETVELSDLGDAHFETVLQNRLAFFARPDTPRATLTPDALLWLRDRFGSDLRECERFLYEHFQTNVRTPEPITARELQRSP